MQKVYLLLRNNQQTGPYNLEQLIQFDLKPIDLIWIEGKSAGWYYPQEIKALHPYLPFVKPEPQLQAGPAVQPSVSKPLEATSPKKVFVSLPSGTNTGTVAKPFHQPLNIQEATSSTPASHPNNDNGLKTTYAKSLDDIESDYTKWVYQKRSKKSPAVSRKGLIAACLIVTIAFAGWWALTPSLPSPEHTPTEPIARFSQSNVAGADTASGEKSGAALPLEEKRPALKKGGASKNLQRVSHENPASIYNRPVTVEPTPPEEKDNVVAIPEDQNEAVVEKKPETEATEQPKEKKKLREKFLDLFKKKPEEKVKEEAKPAEEADGQRSSVKRETGTNLAQLVSIRFTVPNDWMMGIKGAKATFSNKSSQKILKATVEVQYYNEDNELLEKKTVSFSGVEAKKTQTIAIPDHSTATRLEYKIISVIGENEPYARL